LIVKKWRYEKNLFVIYNRRIRIFRYTDKMYLQCTCSIIRLLTDGGTPLLAMHR